MKKRQLAKKLTFETRFLYASAKKNSGGAAGLQCRLYA